MKLTMKFSVLLFGVLMLANIANAETPREQLKQMVEQLQKSPGNEALREKIITLAYKLKPAPGMPDTAVEFEGRAQFAFKSAKSNDDYLAAAREYEKAVAAAPWVTGYYSDLCTIYEKAGKFEEAKRNCEFSLIGLFDAAQITDIKRRIAGLKYGIEQNSPSAVAERENEQVRKFLANLEGGIWNGKILGDPAHLMRLSYEVRNGRLVYNRADWSSDRAEPTSRPGYGEWESMELKSNRVTYSSKAIDPKCNPVTVQISEDGESIEQSYTCYGETDIQKFLRKH